MGRKTRGNISSSLGLQTTNWLVVKIFQNSIHFLETLKQTNEQPALDEALNEAAELKKILEIGREKAKQMPEHKLIKVTDLRASLFSPN